MVVLFNRTKSNVDPDKAIPYVRHNPEKPYITAATCVGPATQMVWKLKQFPNYK